MERNSFFRRKFEKVKGSAEAAGRRWGGWVWPPPEREQAFPATGAAGAGRVGIITLAVGNPQERLATAN